MRHLTLLSLLCLSTLLHAASIKGVIYNNEGEVLPYASIVVSGSQNGSFSNENGEFELNLDPGTYEVSFRYIGYKTVIKTYKLGREDIEVEIVLSPSITQLKEVVVGQGEDPALTIMRKTIAMSTIHYKELATYSYKAYTKGNLKVIDVPFLLEKEMEKQFMKVGQLYVFESLVDFNFKQPNQLTERTIAKKDNLPPTLKNAFNLNLGAFGFYDPSNTMSPVTRKGSRNYRYEYLGFFEENGKTINKIKVIPKARGSDSYSGILNIVDKSWYVHSYDFKSRSNEGFLKSKVIYKETDDVWVPIQFDNAITLDILGINAEIRAIASIRDLKITKNPRFAQAIPEVYDDKLFDAPPVASRKPVGLKDFSKLKKELIKAQKEEEKAIPNSDYDRVAVYSRDTLFDQKDSLFWEAKRLVPLTGYEIEGFRLADSIVLANKDKIAEKMQEDSTESERANKFKIQHLIVGGRYRYGQTADTLNKTPRYSLQLGPVLSNVRFNAVQGFGLGPGDLTFHKNNDDNSYFSVKSNVYYAFAQQRAFGNIGFEKGQKNYVLKVSAGADVLQVNRQNPISNLINASYALLGNEHRAKFFQQEYFSGNLLLFPESKFQFQNQVEWARRTPLPNELSKSPIREGREGFFETNEISNTSGTGIPFERNNLTTWSSTFSFYPFLQKSKINGRVRLQNLDKTQLNLTHKLGFGSSGFGLIDFSAKHNFTLGTLDWESRANAGFFYKKPTYFLDFKHFNGNVVIANSHGDFRNLPYYDFSASNSYLQLFNTLKPSKILITQLNFVRKSSMKEYVFHNLLSTPLVNHNELGYGWEFLQGALNLEVVRSWTSSETPNFAFRIWSRVN